MGYACPICEEVHPDETHLAHHIAVAASVDREDHRSWLAEHAPDWQSMGPEELGAIVTDRAEPVETRPLEDQPSNAPTTRSHDSLTGEAEAILEEARDLTRQMHGVDDGDEDA